MIVQFLFIILKPSLYEALSTAADEILIRCILQIKGHLYSRDKNTRKAVQYGQITKLWMKELCLTEKHNIYDKFNNYIDISICIHFYYEEETTQNTIHNKYIVKKKIGHVHFSVKKSSITSTSTKTTTKHLFYSTSKIKEND